MTANYEKKRPACNNTYSKGMDAEEKVSYYLENMGFKILDRNFAVYMAGEIDIIAKRGNTLFFVEVKYRKNNNTFDISNGCICAGKLRKLKKCADIYLQKNKTNNYYCKFIGAMVQKTGFGKIPKINTIYLD